MPRSEKELHDLVAGTLRKRDLNGPERRARSDVAVPPMDQDPPPFGPCRASADANSAARKSAPSSSKVARRNRASGLMD
jgi:hypothetical protein